MSEWISVKDRLPEKEKPVLAYAENGWEWVVATYDLDNCWFDHEYCTLSVTHWMHLPEPPGTETDYTEVGLEEPEDIDFPCDAPSLVQTICIGKEK